MRKISSTPATIEKLPNVVKTEMNTSPARSAASMPSCLTSSSSTPSRPRPGRGRAHDVVGQVRARELVAAVGDEDVLHAAATPEQRLAAIEREQDARAVRAGAVEVDDGGDARRLGATAREQPHRVARTRVEHVGGVAIQVHLAGPQLRQRPRRAVRRADRVEAGHPRRVGGEQPDACLGLPAAQVLHRDRLHDRRRHAVDQAGRAQRALDRRHVALVQVLDAAGASPLSIADDVSAPRDGHELVGRPERLDHRRRAPSGSSCRRSRARRR